MGKVWILVVAAGLVACSTPAKEEFTSGGSGAPDQRTRDYAACKNQASAVTIGASGYAGHRAYNKALKNCMVAKGYAVADD